jgi:hypothetical protein
MSLDPVTFNFAARRHRVPESVMIEALRSFARAREGRPVTMRDFDKWKDKPCGSCTITQKYGSWHTALKRAGLRPLRCMRHNPEELVANLEEVWRRIGRPPGRDFLRKFGSCPLNAYRKHWGSVEAACRRLADYHAGNIARDELLRATLNPAKSPRKGLPPRRRWHILERDRHRCTACGRAAADGLTLHIDHIIPVSKGGGDDDANLRVLCSECNFGRGNQSEAVGAQFASGRQPVVERKALMPRDIRPLGPDPTL